MALGLVANDSAVYAAWALACTIFVSTTFYGYLLTQTGGIWSAPLDDVFIHFDYARAFARGFPFQWSEGNGYSSGNTSLSYPAVLSVGYWIGFRHLWLMAWAAIVANISVFFFLFSTGRLVDGLAEQLDPEAGRDVSWIKYLFPPAVLSMGALDWTLWSGMENAWHLGCWGLALAALDRQLAAPDLSAMRRRAWFTGVMCALLVSARPESGVCVAAFSIYGAYAAAREGTAPAWRARLFLVAAAASPALGMLALHAAANRFFTGEWSANGAIAKVIFEQPYLTRAEMLDRYFELLRYIKDRLLEHHFADLPPWGELVPALALVPLFVARLRPIALLLWCQILGWIFLVATNLQLRWHNERYAMPAVAWLLLAAALGLGALVTAGARHRVFSRIAGPRTTALRFVGAGLVAAAYWLHQAPRMRDQIWFMARASRNIFDQHVTAGFLLEKLAPKRILVGDAGALTYISDRPGLDLIGLGGYGRLPFARATNHGLGAALELIERMPPGDRPDLMALYPTWWGDLPTQFGRVLTSIPVRGNVICGGAEKVLYRANWTSLDKLGTPRSLEPGMRVIDELDFADLVSEKLHEHNLPQPGLGFVHFRLLADPSAPQTDLFDAGRSVPAGVMATGRMRAPSGGGRLILRLAPDHIERIAVTFGGHDLGVVVAAPSTGAWHEVFVTLPALNSERALLELRPEGQVVLFHAWTVE
ncbi:MAG: hypothetical protein EXR75_07890 [Myxococcales bacterium]|nr:hypothetical protein [Myxococcales bacterium]